MLPETYEEELSQALLRIISIENELKLQINYQKQLDDINKDKIEILENEKQELFDRELKSFKKIKELNDKIEYYESDAKDNNNNSEINKEMF